MAPTICSEKKRQLRGTLKCKRAINSADHQTQQLPHSHHHHHHNRNGGYAAASVINFVAKGTIATAGSSSLRLHLNSAFHAAKIQADGSMSVTSSTGEVSRKAVNSHTPSLDVLTGSSNTNMSSSSSCCDNQENQKVTSTTLSDMCSLTSPTSSFTTNGAELIRRTFQSAQADSAISEGDYSSNSMLVDLESSDATDAEVHSIISNSCCSMDSTATLQTRLPLQTVFTSQQYDKNNNNNNSHHSNRNISQSYRDVFEIKNCEGLLAIAIKTIKLVKRNQMLQRRLMQLQMETSDFIKSVLANPENKHFSDKIKYSSPK